MSLDAACPSCGELIPDDAPAGACPGCMLLLASDFGPDDSLLGHRPPTIDKLQEFFPQYRIESLAGVGGQAVVYRALDVRGDRRVALKILTAEQSAHPEFLSRFSLEARALAQLVHPGIVGILDSGQAGDYFYIAMPWIAGATLRDRLRERPLDSATASDCISQICQAVDYAHRQGIVHRDLKPENVLIGDDGQTRIADFGIAKILDDSPADGGMLTAAHARLGTARYMAPEQMRGEPRIDGRADIYAIGVMLFEMLTGELPLPYGQPPSKIASVSPAYDRIVARCLKPEPENRYKSAAEVDRQVQRAARSLPAKSRRMAVATILLGALGMAAWFGWQAAAPNVPQPVGVAALLADSDWTWSPPENLGPLVNTPGNDHAPCLSADGLTLLYHGRGHAQGDNVDIWQCRRATKQDAWGPPENLGPTINHPGHWEGDPCLSADGLTLFFSSEWRKSKGLRALFQSRRADLDAPWSEPMHINLYQKDALDQDRSPALSSDGCSLWFARGSAKHSSYDLLLARRTTAEGEFGPPTSVGPPINTIAVESDPEISSDGQTLLWTVPASPTPYDLEIWWSYRADATSGWQAPRRLSPEISVQGAAEPCLSADGSELYFSSARVRDAKGDLVENHGGVDIYVSRRVRRAARAASDASPALAPKR